LGKFFGLAGLRLGFVLAEPLVLELLSERLGPWAVNGPAQYLGLRAMMDKDWHAEQQQRISNTMDEQMALLNSIDWGSKSSVLRGPLYCCVAMSLEAIEYWYNRCGKQGILTRRFVRCEHNGLLRFGLIKDAEQLKRLAKALKLSVIEPRSSNVE
jgi:cobalamin biosynthetic protein CobC